MERERTLDNLRHSRPIPQRDGQGNHEQGSALSNPAKSACGLEQRTPTRNPWLGDLGKRVLDPHTPNLAPIAVNVYAIKRGMLFKPLVRLVWI